MRRMGYMALGCLAVFQAVQVNLKSFGPSSKPNGNSVVAISNATDKEVQLMDFPTTEELLLLSVPFYVYEEIAWENATFSGQPVKQLAGNPGARKHSDDFYFMKASLSHPMRTKDPSKAKLFVIPVLLNYYFSALYKRQALKNSKKGRGGKSRKKKNRYLCAHVGGEHLCDDNLMDRAISTVKKSEWFQSHPELHVVVNSSWKARKRDDGVLSEVNNIIFEKSTKQPTQASRMRFPSYYVGSGCLQNQLDTSKGMTTTTIHNKTQDVAMIATLNKKFEDRRNICKWIQSHNSKTASDYTASSTSLIRMTHCGHGEQCPALGHAKFGFHVRGDTLGSNRLMDILLSGTVPIFTLRGQYDILPPWIDWKQLSVLLPMRNADGKTPKIDIAANSSSSTFTTKNPAAAAFLQSLQAILQDEEGYQTRQKAVVRHRDIFDWDTLHPFDHYMYMLQAELFPETRHEVDKVSSWWPALILPPPTLAVVSSNKTNATTELPTRNV